MQIHQIKRTHTWKKIKRVGRGATRGTYSGRGIKGQKARAGRKMRPEMRDIIKKIHKKRGYAFSSFRDKPAIVNVGGLNVFAHGDAITPRSLFKQKLVRMERGVLGRVKILGTGELNKKLSISGCIVSASAKVKIEKAGGTIQKK